MFVCEGQRIYGGAESCGPGKWQGSSNYCIQLQQASKQEEEGQEEGSKRMLGSRGSLSGTVL